MTGFGFEVDIVTLIDAVIVGGGLGLKISLGDGGAFGIIHLHHIDGGGSFGDAAKAFLGIIGIGFIDARFKIHAAISSGDFGGVFLLIGGGFARVFGERAHSCGVFDLAHLRLSSTMRSKSSGVTVLPSERRLRIFFTGGGTDPVAESRRL